MKSSSLLILAVLINFVCVFSQENTLLTNPFYVQSYSLLGTPEEVAQKIGEAGYDGLMWESNIDDVVPLITALHDRGLVLGAFWRDLNGTDWEYILTLIQDTEADLVVPVNGYARDDEVVADLAALADRVQPEGRKVLIYPHWGFYVENTEHAVALVKQANRENVGTVFNLCHSLRYHSENGLSFVERFDSIIENAFPHVFGVSINGADTLGTDWGVLIQTLGLGNFDTFGLVKAFIDRGFEGPFYLQMYGIGGDETANLAAAFSEWQTYQSLLPAGYGCMNPDYEEFDPTATVHVEDSCRTLSVSLERDRENPTGGVFLSGSKIIISGQYDHLILIINTRGELVGSLAGIGNRTYDLSNLPGDGVYILRIELPQKVITRRIVNLFPD
jgi:sugar phosphate isomerase/epimerase